MKKRKNTIPSLKVNVSWTFIGNIIYALTQWGQLVAVAKYGNALMVGQFTLGLALTAPVIMLTNLQLRTVQATDINDRYTFSDYLGLRTLTVFAFMLIMTSIIFLLENGWETKLVIFIITCAKMFESISDIIYGLLQKNEAMKNIAISKIYKGITSLIIMVILLKSTGSLILSVVGLSIAWLVTLIFIDIRQAKKFEVIRINYNLSKFKKILLMSLPLGIAHMLGSLNTNIPRYLLEFFVNEEALGYFAAIAYLIVSGSTIILAIGHTVTPRLSRYYSTNKRKFVQLILKLMIIGFIIGLGGIVITLIAGDELLTLIYSSEYTQYTHVLLLIMIASTFIYTGSFLGYGITAAQFFKIQPIMNISWIITSIVAGFIFIPKFEVVGAAYTLIFSSIIQFLTRVLVIIIILKKKPKKLERS